MISVVLVPQGPVALSQVFAALVPAAIDGLVKEVIVAGGGEDPMVLNLVEDSGARLVAADGDRGTRLAAGCAGARGDWILALDPATPLPDGWRAPVEAHLERGGGRAAWLGAPGLANRLSGRMLGLLARRTDYDAAGGFKPGSRPERALARALGAKRIG